eukprot:760611-Hanusia_phi.AAC.1
MGGGGRRRRRGRPCPHRALFLSCPPPCSRSECPGKPVGSCPTEQPASLLVAVGQELVKHSSQNSMLRRRWSDQEEARRVSEEEKWRRGEEEGLTCSRPFPCRLIGYPVPVILVSYRILHHLPSCSSGQGAAGRWSTLEHLGGADSLGGPGMK